MPRAVVDIGSNTVLMLVGERDAAGQVHVRGDFARITRLGQGAAARGSLAPEAVERTLAVLREYGELARTFAAEIVAVATEGLRMAGDPEAFLVPARAALGADIRLISGDEEAELSYLSVARECPADAPLRVLDIGGGSTELIVGEGQRILDRRSHRIGSVRLTEHVVRNDPPTADELSELRRLASEAFATQPVVPYRVLHGLAGTVTSAGALHLGLSRYDRETVDGVCMPHEKVAELRDLLAAQTVAQRSASPILGPGRGDVIVAGMAILLAAMEHCGAETLVVRDRGLRFALI